MPRSAAPREKGPPPGLPCPCCGARAVRVLETRPRRGNYIYRRRECDRCGEVVISAERVVGTSKRRAA